MKTLKLIVMFGLVPMILAACQSSNVAVSSYAGHNLAGDVKSRVIVQPRGREGVQAPARRLNRATKPRRTAALAPSSADRERAGSVTTAPLTRRAPAATRTTTRTSADRAGLRTVSGPPTREFAARQKIAKRLVRVQRSVTRKTVKSRRKATTKRRIVKAKVPLRRTRVAKAKPRIAPKVSKKAQAKQAAVRQIARTTVPSVRGEGSHTRYRNMVAKYAKQNGVPVKLALAVVEVESNYKPKATGRAGEIGLMQILPRTARGIGYKGKMKDLYNPDTNIRYGMKYLGEAYKRGGGTTCGAILKYNAGHYAKKMNPISRQYCKKVSAILKRG